MRKGIVKYTAIASRLSVKIVAAAVVSVLATNSGTTLARASSALSFSPFGVMPAGKLEVTHVGSLEAGGEGLFWEGPHLEREVVFWELCGIQGPCYGYDIEVAEGGSRLRVLLDVPDLFDHWAFALVPPGGRTVEPLVYDPSSMDKADLTTNEWTSELWVDDPTPGTWQAIVVPVDVTDASFRMRANLEEAQDEGHGKRELLPNLRAFPAFQPTFAAPARQVHVGGAPNTPISAAGQQPVSCTGDETLEKNAGKCLRFTSGIENVGLGPVQLTFDSSDVSGNTGRMQQVVTLSDGSTYSRASGEYEFHKTHAHFHNKDMASVQLMKVSYEGRTAILEPVGVGAKSGFCLLDTMISEYRSADDKVDSDPQSIRVSSCEVAGGGTMYLNRGWIDVYGWYLPGQYVDFGNNDDGEYVVRYEVDAANTVLETNERDNVAYTWLNVSGNTIDVLERGRGENPWDPLKEILDSSFHSAVTYPI